MEISIRSSSLILLLVAMTFSNFKPTFETIFPSGKNFAIFERIICRTYPGSKVRDVQCRVKYIDRNNVKALVMGNLSEPVPEVWLHGIIYYKYNTYQKIGTEYWDDLCAWIAGRTKSFFLDFLRPLIFEYTNFNHTCPYQGSAIVKFDNVSVQKFAFPQIVPAGRYRLDAYFTEGNRRTLLAGGSLYVSVSDHRIEIV